MKKEILIESELGQTRLAVMEDGSLMEYYVERRGQEKLPGSIFVGRVANILPGMQAAFVNIGLEKNAFLHAGDIKLNKSDFGADAEKLERVLAGQSIGQMVRMGQELLVQVVKDPGGTKGPRISSHVTLPGRLAVLLPTVNYVGISRRIEGEAVRGRLRAVAEACRPDGMGLIVRTAAATASEEDFRRDVESLVRLWRSIQTRARHTAAPALIHRDEDIVYRAVRDMLSPDVDRFLVEGQAPYQAALEAAEMLSPELVGRIALYEEKTPLFDVYRVDALLEKGLQRHVWLKSGGFLVIDHTEALTVIDVNTGKYVGSKNLDDTVYKINCEAAQEIARQLRLRDTGGIIVIDFIDMDMEAHREGLLSLMRQLLKNDRTKTNLVGLTGLGLVEMTRKKIQQPIHTLLKRPCPDCGGSGFVDSEETIARRILHELRGQAAVTETPCWLVKASQNVAGQLMLAGAPEGVRAFALPEPLWPDRRYAIEPAVEENLPGKARALPQFA
ncbi:MAG: Rne/Rng family ribonuclease [Clostridia bacterium]|nr:Rne/Rng family ribonuclease [Clostridia bacterium]